MTNERDALVKRLQYIADTDDAKFSEIRDTLLEAIAALTAQESAACGEVVVPREYGIVKRDFIASSDTPQKRGALPTVTVVFPVEDWVARDRFADALLHFSAPVAAEPGVRGGEAIEYLRELVTALEGSFISSWQSTAGWQKQLDAASEFLAASPAPAPAKDKQ